MSETPVVLSTVTDSTTEPIKKSRLTRRSKIILASTAAAITAVVAGVVVVNRSGDDEDDFVDPLAEYTTVETLSDLDSSQS